MAIWRRLASWLSWFPWYRRGARDADLERELRDHLELEAEEQRAAGLSLKQADYAAHRALGNTLKIEEDVRAAWGFQSFENFAQDVRYAFRMLRKSPGFTAVAVLTLAIGIGANTAMFSVVHAVLLRPLPYPDEQRLANLTEFDPRDRPISWESMSYPDFLDIRARSATLKSIAAYRSNNLIFTGGPEPIRVEAETVSASLFGLLGVQPQLGRGFTEKEDDAPPFVVILSDHFWRTQFNANPNVIGQTIRLNGNACSVIGVMPRGFQFPIRAEGVDLWSSFAPQNIAVRNVPPAVQRDNHFFGAIARMKPGITLEQANADLASIAHALGAEYPSTNTHTAIEARPELEHIVGDTRVPLLILFAAAGLVLLITSTNVTNLLLARATVRAREMAVRAAIGASRSRIVRQLVAESLVLSMLGAAFGMATAYAALAGVLHLYPSNLPRAQDVRIDLMALLFTVGLAILTAILFGLAPALHSARPNLTNAMRQGSAATSAGPVQNRLRSGLVIAEAALGVALVIAAGLLLRSFQRLSHASLGFNPSRLLTAQFNLSEMRYNRDQRERFLGELLDRIRALPGVTAAAATVPLPLDNDSDFANFDILERPLPKERQPLSGFYIVTPGFFEAMQIPLVSGRFFDERDRRGSARVMIITDSFANEFFPGENPLGKCIAVEISEGGQPENERTREIVGVVGDIRRSNLRNAPVPAYYVPLPQLVSSPQTLLVRTPGDPNGVTAAIRSTLAAMDPDAALYDVRTMMDTLVLDLGLARFQTALLSLFAAIALLLTAIGLYGVMSYSVSQRTHELGIRRALGATGSDVLGLILARGVSLTLAGVGIGLVAALALAQFISSLLYRISPRDPASFLLAACVLIFVALAACYIPARRAMRVDPMVALRYE